MIRPRRKRFLPILLLCAALSSGCSTMKLRYSAPMPSEAVKGEIGLVLEDRRPGNRGGDEPLRVGTIRNAVGMPFALKAAADREPSKVVKGLVAECLEASGYRIVEPAPGVPVLYAALTVFWTDGYAHSRVVVELPLELRADANAEPVWSDQIEANTGVTWTVGYSQFDRGFTGTLELARELLLAELGGRGFTEAYASLR